VGQTAAPDIKEFWESMRGTPKFVRMPGVSDPKQQGQRLKAARQNNERSRTLEGQRLNELKFTEVGAKTLACAKTREKEAEQCLLASKLKRHAETRTRMRQHIDQHNRLAAEREYPVPLAAAAASMGRARAQAERHASEIMKGADDLADFERRVLGGA
jgi:hypothetical protein